MSELKQRAKQAATSIEATAKRAYEAAPRSHGYEFGGLPGTVGIVLAVTFFSFFFGIACNERGCPPSPWVDYLRQGAHSLTSLEFYLSLWDAQAVVAYLAWTTYCVACWAILPGEWIEGSVLRDGTKLGYKINGARGPALSIHIADNVQALRPFSSLRRSSLVASLLSVPSRSSSSPTIGSVSSPQHGSGPPDWYVRGRRVYIRGRDAPAGVLRIRRQLQQRRHARRRREHG